MDSSQEWVVVANDTALRLERLELKVDECLNLLRVIKAKQDADDILARNRNLRQRIPFPFHAEHSK